MINFTNLLRLNWPATIALNYRTGGLQRVFRMPIKVYGRLKWHVGGKIILPEHAIRNTLIIGSWHEDYTSSAGRAEISIDGTWIIGGIIRIGHDCFIGVRDGAVLQMGDGCMIGRDTQIHCSHHVSLGKDVIAGETYITDSAEHQIVDNGERKPMLGKVEVGAETYLGFRCMLLKGCMIPPRSVVASGAVCTRDYTTEGQEMLLLAGTPAAVRKTGVYAEKYSCSCK